MGQNFHLFQAMMIGYEIPLWTTADTRHSLTLSEKRPSPVKSASRQLGFANAPSRRKPGLSGLGAGFDARQLRLSGVYFSGGNGGARYPIWLASAFALTIASAFGSGPNRLSP